MSESKKTPEKGKETLAVKKDPAQKNDKGSKDPIAAANSSANSFTYKFVKVVAGVETWTIIGSIFIAMVLGSLVVAFSTSSVTSTLSYFFARPGDFFSALGNSFANFFYSLFVGAVIDPNESGMKMFLPLTSTLTEATPLILAGLSVAVAFQAGLFNIGAQGQILIGALMGGVCGFLFHLPVGLHLIVCIFMAMLGGFLWGAIPGILKAKTGANEVIVTIMLNTIAGSLVSYFLTWPSLIVGTTKSISKPLDSTAMYPAIASFVPNSRLHLGFIVALVAALAVWWLMDRSTLGFEIRAAGANPEAAKTAGINVPKVTFLTMAIAGLLSGLAATGPVLGTAGTTSANVASSYGFDAITVALLGKSKPGGVVAAGILFGALASAKSVMQVNNIPVDIVQITQALIVLLIAASEAYRYYHGKKLAHKAALAADKKGAKVNG